MSNNLVLVGFGYMARRIADKLKNDGLQSDRKVFSLSRSAQIQPAWLEHISWDLDQPATGNFPHSLIFDYSSILYLAPPPSTGKTDPRMANFLSLIEQSASLPAKIILISTTGVYGNCDGAWVDESFAVQPEVARAYRRASAEKQLQEFCSKQSISCTILRVSGIYAKDKLPLERIKKQLPVVDKASSPYSNRIHAQDLTNICCQALEEDHVGVFNCSDCDPTTMTDYFMRLAENFHLAKPPIISMQQAHEQLSPGMFSYMQESRRISNKKLLTEFQMELRYPSLSSFLDSL
ncbi:MAG: SDR family NAD(P)-dependent oxidoreductase [Pseudomonadota bacterium]